MSQTAFSPTLGTALKSRFSETANDYQKAPAPDEEDKHVPEEPSNDEELRETSMPRRSYWRVLLIQLACLLWTAPIVYLLILNFENHIIGASAWCPKHDCWLDAFNDSTVVQRNLAKFASNDHNFLNMLQYVAKLLEIWFGAISGALIYFLVMHIAASKHALPVRLLTLPNQFPNVLSWLGTGIWSTLGKATTLDSRALWTCLIMFGIFMCILSNFMGPAIGTLVIPTLKWIETANISQANFGALLSEDFPAVASSSGFALTDSGCSALDFQEARFSCSTRWATTLDGWVSYEIAREDQLLSGETRAARSPSEQGPLTLYFNGTVDDYTDIITFWIPSRQVLSQLATDQTILMNMSQGATASQIGIPEKTFRAYTPHNNSLQLQLQRTGPILGASMHIQLQGMFPITIDETRSIYCFTNYVVDAPIFPHDGTNFTKGIPRGSGWPKSVLLQENEFNIQTVDDQSANLTSNPIVVEVIGSSKAVFLPNGSSEASEPSTSLPADCLRPDQDAPADTYCDWMHFFSDDYNKYSSSNLTSLVNKVLFWQNTDAGYLTLAIDYVAWLGYTTYLLDPWLWSNPVLLVQTRLHPEDLALEPVPIHPSWTFAALAVDWSNGLPPWNRTMALLCLSVFRGWASDIKSKNETPDSLIAVIGASLAMPILQTLSLIEWSYNTTSVSDLHLHPDLTLNARMYVWAYGFDSKTSKFGAAVAIAGCTIAVLQFVIGLILRRRSRDLTQLLVAALAHKPHSDFTEVKFAKQSESAIQFLVKAADGELGGLTYRHVRS